MTREEAIEYFEEFQREIDELYHYADGNGKATLDEQREPIALAISALRELDAKEGGSVKRYYAVTMPNGEIYGIPAHVIADNYANYYATKGEDYQENYDAMLYWFDTNDYNFADWAKDNMDWDDVKERAVLLGRLKESCDFQDGWVNGDYEYKFVEEHHE